jgi:hypothetical protein
MVEQANVHVKNVSVNGVEFEAFLEHSDGTREPVITIPANSEEKILLPELGVLLKIIPPQGIGTNVCQFYVTKNGHLVSWESMDDHWEMQLTENEDKPEVPTDVNVEVSGPPPAP